MLRIGQTKMFIALCCLKERYQQRLTKKNADTIKESEII